MIVEFIGSPASGKSTISNYLHSDLKKDHLVFQPSYEIARAAPLKRIIKKSVFILYFVLMHPIQSFTVVKVVVKSSQENILSFLRVTGNILFVCGLITKYRSRAYNDALVLLDQGLIQALWSIQLSAKKKCIHSLFSIPHYILPDSIVVVSAPNEELLQRLKERTLHDSRLDKLADSQLHEQLNRSKTIINELLYESHERKIRVKKYKIEVENRI